MSPLINADLLLTVGLWLLGVGSVGAVLVIVLAILSGNGRGGDGW